MKGRWRFGVVSLFICVGGRGRVGDSYGMVDSGIVPFAATLVLAQPVKRAKGTEKGTPTALA